jgi:hypothetical protein
MGCGCKKRQETKTQTTTMPQMINVSVAEQDSKKLNETQEKLVNQIVDKLKQIDNQSD